ncbi:MAG: glutamine-hydrolyzing GMP synthase [Hyphomonadaceae bacterium]|nr:glutamine-hydrolyzing GMP synthase [Hyphomonadaceae bacterium]MBC6411913.1 glutamine-hydrolyzing GMP synthase [Hyphomonadaceae bacterium]
MSQHHDKILIVDFGSQLTKLIARRVRENGVYSEIHPYNKVGRAFLEGFDPKAVILSGGPNSVTGMGSPRADTFIFGMGIPVLGICYGQQVMCAQLGGSVEQAREREFGRAHINIVRENELFAGLSTRERVWMSHGDRVSNIPDGFEIIAQSANAPFAAIADESRKFYGVQFHPEVAHTEHGAVMLRNFTHKIAGFSGDWTMAAFKDEAITAIREKVGDAKVICGLSGGVDSSVTAILIYEAVREQLTCVYVDTGMMRKGESEQVVSLFRQHYNINLIFVDASTRFMEALEGVTDPEAKRGVIGKTFVDIFDKQSSRVEGAKFLAQGTLYPDVIESVSFDGGPSVTIKSHHNVGGLPERMKLELIEPLRELFKDEVRDLGRQLGLHDDFVRRHPFPGPGLAIRCPGAVTKQRLDMLREADAIYMDQIRKYDLYDEIWQAFTVILPVQSVGVMGDERTYENVLALRAVTSTDGMTADYYPYSHGFLSETATRIINEVRGVNRVVYDITSKPPGTIEWE